MYGKWYARLKSIETLSLTNVAKHISEHGSVFTEDVVEGVLKKFKNCLLEMLLDSKKVKIAGLGTFYLTCECTKGGAEKEEDFNVNQHLAALHIRFLPDQAEEDNLSSREFIKKADFVNIKNLLSNKDDSEGSGTTENGGSQGGSQSGSQSGEQGGSQSGNEGSQSGDQNQATSFALTITKSGSGTSTVKNDSEETINSGDTLASGANVYISVTPAEGQIPTATLNGSNISLTENDGEYIGTFQMPAQASSLVINSGSDSEEGDQN
jgi:predicted histone-like DNA-binding protein